MRIVRVLLLPMLLAVTCSIHAESMRCGTRLVDTGDTKADVLMRCGEPMLKEVGQWTYNPGWGKFLKLVIFRGGIVDSIKDGPRMGNQ